MPGGPSGRFASRPVTNPRLLPFPELPVATRENCCTHGLPLLVATCGYSEAISIGRLSDSFMRGVLQVGTRATAMTVETGGMDECIAIDVPLDHATVAAFIWHGRGE